MSVKPSAGWVGYLAGFCMIANRNGEQDVVCEF
jgi:hypothetical protein